MTLRRRASDAVCVITAPPINEVITPVLPWDSRARVVQPSGEDRLYRSGFRDACQACIQTVRPRTLNETTVIICLDTYILRGVYQESGISVRSHCGAEPPRDIEPPGLVTTVGWRDRRSASHGAADRVQAPASAARGRFRGIQGGRSASSLPAETGTTSGGRCLAGSVPPVLVRSRGCSRTPPRPHRAFHANEKEDNQRTTRPKPRT